MKKISYFFTPLFLIISIFFARSACADRESAPASQQTEQGKTLCKKGDFEGAAQLWEQAAKFLDPGKDAGACIDTLVNLAAAYQTLGYFPKALETLDRAAPVIEKSRDSSRKAQFFSTLGDVCFSLGDTQKAFAYLEQALTEAQQTDNPFLLASIFNHVGIVLAKDGDCQGARDAFDACLGICEESGKESREWQSLKAGILLNVIRVASWCEDSGVIESASDVALREIEKMPDNYQKAFALTALGQLGSQIVAEFPQAGDGLKKTAHSALVKARGLAYHLKDSFISSCTYGYAGQLYEAEKQYSDAISLTRSAIFFARQKELPEISYRWQWQLGRLFKAKGDMEHASRAYQAALSTLDLKMNPVRHHLSDGYRSLSDTFEEQVKPVYLGFAELLLDQAEELRGNERQNKLKQARDVMERLKKSELQNFFQDECVTAMQGRQTELNRMPPRTAALYPIPLPEKLVLLLTLPDGMMQFRVPTDIRTFRNTVKTFRKRLQIRSTRRFLHEARQLHDWLIRPLENELAAQDIHTLIVVPDGPLRLIPFSALQDGKRFLVEKYAIATLPAITLTEPRAFESEKARLLLSGISEKVIVDDPLGYQLEFPPLPSVPDELEEIRGIMGEKTRRTLQDKDYTIAKLSGELKREKKYSLLHIATHGVFGGTPQETYLLAHDGRLTMNRLEQILRSDKFHDTPLELLTLSACQTAMGNERAGLGLAGVAVKAGVRSVIATLWFVDDQATSLAISEFYRELEKGKISKAQALQTAQKYMISTGYFRHPAYWAPFLLIGNWL